MSTPVMNRTLKPAFDALVNAAESMMPGPDHDGEKLDACHACTAREACRSILYMLRRAPSYAVAIGDVEATIAGWVEGPQLGESDERGHHRVFAHLYMAQVQQAALHQADAA